MSIVEVDEKYRITLPKEVRRSLVPLKGRKAYIVGAGDVVVVRILASDPSEALREILGDFTFDRRSREEAERWLLEQVRST
ncbi:MAG: AbrB/MazE/SpoVT family DNA-binding domain-containing protein [Candidatus Bathyarchaeia archaeon]|nr:AbrB/MazE/SpoVT family DNA-binding domain-containing protein [Candidatus Bathyarchaeota archaeon]